MNQRIRELAEQAERYTNDTVDERVHNRDFTFGDIDEVYNTKFAELIVRECANLPFKATGEVTTIGEIAVSNLILKHFGVEE